MRKRELKEFRKPVCLLPTSGLRTFILIRTLGPLLCCRAPFSVPSPLSRPSTDPPSPVRTRGWQLAVAHLSVFLSCVFCFPPFAFIMQTALLTCQNGWGKPNYWSQFFTLLEALGFARASWWAESTAHLLTLNLAVWLLCPRGFCLSHKEDMPQVTRAGLDWAQDEDVWRRMGPNLQLGGKSSWTWHRPGGPQPSLPAEQTWERERARVPGGLLPASLRQQPTAMMVPSPPFTKSIYKTETRSQPISQHQHRADTRRGRRSEGL